jgi:hypothetical protein
VKRQDIVSQGETRWRDAVLEDLTTKDVSAFLSM